MDISILFISILVGYLMGAISFSRIAGKILLPKEDLLDVQIPSADGTGTHTIPGISATTIGFRVGEKEGCIVGLLDMFKVALPMIVFRILFPGQPYFLFTAVAGMLGHNWPVYYGFKGGHGFSIMYGSLLVVDWLGAVVTSLAGMFIGIFVLKNFLYVYLLMNWLIVPWLWFRTQDFYYLGYGLAINIIFIIAMIPDIRQIREREKESGKSAKKEDLRASMASSPMGKGILKLADRFHIPIG